MSPLQLATYWRLCVICFFTSFYYFFDIFAAAIVTDTCRHGNGTVSLNATPGEKNNQSLPSESEPDWTVETRTDESVCGWTDWLPYSQTSFMVGMLLGSLVGGAISDRYGKRPTLLVCQFLCVGCSLVPTVLPQPLLFLVIRCLTGVYCCCIHICIFSLAVEWTPPAARLWPPAILPFCFSQGMMCGALLAWLSPTLMWLHLSLALPQAVCLPLFISIPESPGWLVIRSRTDVLDRYRNSSPADKNHLDLLLGPAQLDLQKSQKEPPLGDDDPSDLIYFRHPTVLLRLFVMSYLSAVTAMTYFGICMNIGSFGVDVYSAQFFSGLSEAPCLLVPLVRLGRRALSILALFLSGAACFLSLLLSRYKVEVVLVMSLALLGKLCILAAMFIFILYGIELFPTLVRQRCMAMVNLCFRIGCLINSLVPPNPNGEISLAAMAVYSSGPILGCGLCLLLPETSGIPLPDSVEDCNRQPIPLPPFSGALCRIRKMRNSRTSQTVAAEKGQL